MYFNLNRDKTIGLMLLSQLFVIITPRSPPSFYSNSVHSQTSGFKRQHLKNQVFKMSLWAHQNGCQQECKTYYNYWSHIISWRFCVRIFLPDSVAISKDIANYGYGIDFWFKRQMVDLLNPRLMIYLLSQMHRCIAFQNTFTQNHQLIIRALQYIVHIF